MNCDTSDFVMFCLLSELRVGIGVNKPIGGHFNGVLEAAKRGGRCYVCKLRLHVGCGRRVEYHEIYYVHGSGRLRRVGRQRQLHS